MTQTITAQPPGFQPCPRAVTPGSTIVIDHRENGSVVLTNAGPGIVWCTTDNAPAPVLNDTTARRLAPGESWQHAVPPSIEGLDGYVIVPDPSRTFGWIRKLDGNGKPIDFKAGIATRYQILAVCDVATTVVI